MTWQAQFPFPVMMYFLFEEGLVLFLKACKTITFYDSGLFTPTWIWYSHEIHLFRPMWKKQQTCCNTINQLQNSITNQTVSLCCLTFKATHNTPFVPLTSIYIHVNSGDQNFFQYVVNWAVNSHHFEISDQHNIHMSCCHVLAEWNKHTFEIF